MYACNLCMYIKDFQKLRGIFIFFFNSFHCFDCLKILTYELVRFQYNEIN